jgi:hypothetical protein
MTVLQWIHKYAYIWFMDMELLLYLVIQLLMWDCIFCEFCDCEIHNRTGKPISAFLAIATSVRRKSYCRSAVFPSLESDNQISNYDELGSVLWTYIHYITENKKKNTLPQGLNKYMQYFESVGDGQQVVWVVCQD